ncbi:MAG: hypothetical protein COC24_010040 [Alphaproteobacteria bacterium]|nr:hypothetical protein [Alphaproteobacteria bacterium]
MDKNEYIRILTEIRNLGYDFEEFNHSKENKAAIIRHDIDFCIDSALEMARIENKLNISATYFFMVSTNMYNICSEASRSLVEQIKDLGHTIALHYDPAIYSDLDKGLTIEKNLLETMFDININVISLHRPRGFIDNSNRKLADVSHTYEDKYFKDMKYMSDSAGMFKYGHPLDQPEIHSGKNLHMLFHPIWWVNSGENQSEKLRNWQTKHFDFINLETALNCTTFDSVRAK